MPIYCAEGGRLPGKEMKKKIYNTHTRKGRGRDSKRGCVEESRNWKVAGCQKKKEKK